MNELIGRLQAELRGWRTGTGHDAGDRAVLVGAVVSALWLVLVLLFWALGPADAPQPGGLARLAAAVAVILPLVLVWIAVGLARAIAELRAEAVLQPGAIRQLLVEQVTGAVRWRESVAFMAEQGVTEFWEIGAGKALSGMIKRIAPDAVTRAVGTPQEIAALKG